MPSTIHDIIDALEKTLEAQGLKLREEERSLIETCSSWPNAAAQLAASVLSGRVMEEALRAHSDALDRAAVGSDKYSKHLALATWALVGMTAILAITTLVALL